MVIKNKYLALVIVVIFSSIIFNIIDSIFSLTSTLQIIIGQNYFLGVLGWILLIIISVKLAETILGESVTKLYKR